jgi:hypothetical protein
MRRIVIAGMMAAGLWTIAAPQSARADDFWSNCRRVLRLNLDWPAPYLQQDRASVNAHYAAMTECGWKTQNMMCDYHFAPSAGKLSQAGELRLRWILTQAPPQHRMVYVQKAGTPEETNSRIDAVQRFSQQIQGTLAMVTETDLDTPGRPAEQVDLISRAALNSMPSPVLPAGSKGGTTAGSTSAGSISSGGGSGGR